MNLYIENEQEKIAFTEEHEALIEKVLNSVLENEGFLEECEISVVITDDENICALNKE